MTISVTMVKDLRDKTGCGMMECKKALEEVNGDIEKAIEHLRKKGMAKADKKADRIAAEGKIVIKVAGDNKTAVVVETNCETDFVARDNNFIAFAEKVTEAALANNIADIAALHELKIGDKTVEELRKELIVKIGENINVRRVDLLSASGILGTYVHGDRIGVMVALADGDATLAKDVAMHIAASKPQVVSPENIAPEIMAKEKEIFMAQAKDSGKPENIIEKMVEGRLRKFASEISLTGQPFVKNPDITVGNLLKENKASVEKFIRFELGEGIEKKSTDFAKEVMEQIS